MATTSQRLRWLALGLLLAMAAVVRSGLRLLNVYLDSNYYPQAVGPLDAIIWQTAFWVSVILAAVFLVLLIKRGWVSPSGDTAR